MAGDNLFWDRIFRSRGYYEVERPRFCQLFWSLNHDYSCHSGVCHFSRGDHLRKVLYLSIYCLDGPQPS